MIGLPGAVRVFLYRGAADMRKSYDGLSGLVREQFGASLFSGALFVFVNRRRTHVKVLYWDRDGPAIWAKRLERGTFGLPRGGTGGAVLSARELFMLLEGIVPLRLNRRYRRPGLPAALPA
jgi:transposase